MSQQHDQQFMPPDVFLPSLWKVLGVQTPQGPRVIIEIGQPTGTTVVGLEADNAREIASSIMSAGRQLKTGLTVIGRVDEEPSG